VSRFAELEETRNWGASSDKPFTATDVAICIWFPLSLVGFFIFALFAHRTLPRFVPYVFALAWILTLFIMPIFVVIHIMRNRNCAGASWLWTESVLAGIWLAMGSAALLNEWKHGSPVSMVAIVIGIAVSLTPLIAKKRRPSA
jgi:hypothetical protein